jgi:hypothetical protein
MKMEEIPSTKKDGCFVLSRAEFLEQVAKLAHWERPGVFIGANQVPPSMDTNTKRPGETVIVGGDGCYKDKLFASYCWNQMNTGKRIGGHAAFLATPAL